MSFFNKVRNLWTQIRLRGFRGCLAAVWRKTDWLILKVIAPFLRRTPLQNTIVIESHNDFDCNGGAFYDYLIKNGYNRKYKIVWLLKHPEKQPPKLPDNVECYPLYAPSVKKDFRICTAKFLLADNMVTRKQRKEQISIFCSHGAGGFKRVKSLGSIGDFVDFALIQSEAYAPIQAEQCGYTPEKMIYIGYPSHDILNTPDNSELKKVSEKSYRKVFLWMPTFRKAGGGIRIDSEKEQPLGIPLIETAEDYEKLNAFLAQNNLLLIIKIHPMQDLDNLKISDKSNIAVLTGLTVKEKDIDNYRLMRCTDALISDYSGAAYEYLQLDRPICYVLDDMAQYTIGFVVEDIRTLMAGPEVYSLEDLYSFMTDVMNQRDSYQEKRRCLRDYIYKYHDTHNCERLAEFMGL